MDKNQVTGLVLISLLLFIYIYFFAPKPSSRPPAVKNQAEAPDTAKIRHSPAETLRPAEKADTATLSEYKEIAPLLTGKTRDIRVENEDAIFTFSTRGGQIKDVLLKEFLTYTKQPLHLIDSASSRIAEVISTRQGDFDINEFYFRTGADDQSISKSDSAKLEFTAEVKPGVFIRRTYKIPGRGYKYFQQTNLESFSSELVKNTVELTWEGNILNSEKDIRNSQRQTTINYYTAAGDFNHLKETSVAREERSVTEPVKWVSLKQKFFSDALIASRPFPSVYFMTEGSADSTIVKHLVFSSTQPLGDYQQGFTYYFGPNNYEILKKVTPGFSKNIYLGWPPVIYVNKFLIIPIFHWLENYIGNYGIIIILLVLIVKIILLPLSYNSYVSMAKTKVLKPQLDAIKQQVGNDMQKVQSEQMKLYQQVGINPLSGCIPVLLQMPILFSMFYFFPNSIELRQQHFLWANDLSTYDSVLSLPFFIPGFGNHISLFTILMTASTILYTWSTSQLSSVTGPMKTMQYIMPVIFMFALNSFPAALTFYYFVSNLITFGQQALIRQFVDERKIERILEENKKKNATKKKSRFQERLEEAMKSTDEQRKKQKK